VTAAHSEGPGEDRGCSGVLAIIHGMREPSITETEATTSDLKRFRVRTARDSTL
jgi:hypothetical protein